MYDHRCLIIVDFIFGRIFVYFIYLNHIIRLSCQSTDWNCCSIINSVVDIFVKPKLYAWSIHNSVVLPKQATGRTSEYFKL